MLNIFPVYINILIVIGLIVSIYYFIKREWKTSTSRNKYVIDKTEIVPAVSYFSYPTDEIQYILWSGGHNSTALLCYYFIVLGKPVQPIFITKIPGPGPGPGPGQAETISGQQKIRDILVARYPHLQSRLLPTWYVISIDKNRNITGTIKKISKTQPTIPKQKLLIWDSIARFADSWTNTICAGNIAESAIFDIPPDIFETTFKNIIFPQATMSTQDIKNMALDSKNYYWDLLNSASI